MAQRVYPRPRQDAPGRPAAPPAPAGRIVVAVVLGPRGSVGTGEAHILGVCAGSALLAGAGVLDGRRATSHWSNIASLRRKHPQVEWVRGQRYVIDGSITTTGGVTSGIVDAIVAVADGVIVGHAMAADRVAPGENGNSVRTGGPGAGLPRLAPRCPPPPCPRSERHRAICRTRS